MVILDSSAWIDYFRGENKKVIKSIENILARELVLIGDIIWCEIFQGVRSESERKVLHESLDGMPRSGMLGFFIAERSAYNYRVLRGKGVTPRSTIDVIIATFCMENSCLLAHCDRDFTHIAKILPLKHIDLRET